MTNSEKSKILLSCFNYLATLNVKYEDIVFSDNEIDLQVIPEVGSWAIYLKDGGFCMTLDDTRTLCYSIFDKITRPDFLLLKNVAHKTWILYKTTSLSAALENEQKERLRNISDWLAS